MSQEDLALILCTTWQTISNYENGKGEPSLEMLNLLSKAFDVSIDSLCNTKYRKTNSIEGTHCLKPKKAYGHMLIPAIVTVLTLTIIFVVFAISGLKGDYQSDYLEIIQITEDMQLLEIADIISYHNYLPAEDIITDDSGKEETQHYFSHHP